MLGSGARVLRRGAIGVVLVMMIVSGILVVLVPGEAEADQDGDYTYTISGSPGVATVTGYTGIGGDITIPSILGSHPVAAIGETAFIDCLNITSVVIPEGVVSIGDAAFYGCKSIVAVTIPGSLESLGQSAFYQCDSLISVELPDGLASIPAYAFYNCTSLASVTIGGNVTSIGDYAFCFCPSLASFTIPGSVQTIGTGAFRSGYSLASVVLNEGLETIGDAAFAFCSPLGSVTIPSTVTRIGYGAFAACSMTNILINSSNANYASIDGVLYNKNGTTLIEFPSGRAGDYVVPEGVTGLDGMAFSYSLNLNSVTLPASLSNVTGYSFMYCESLTAINVNSSNMIVSSMDGVLYNKAGTWLLVVPGGRSAPLVIPVGVLLIGERAAEGNEHLTSLTIPSSATVIDMAAFGSCSNLTSLDVAAFSIGNLAFSRCTSLNDLTIRDGVRYIDGEAFYRCAALESVEIPSSVSVIDRSAFEECWALRFINVSADCFGYSSVDGMLCDKGGETLYVCPPGRTESIIVPEGIETIHDGAFISCKYITALTFPTSLARIDIVTFEENVLSISFLGLTVPSVDPWWLHYANPSLVGHAYAASNFPAPGQRFNGLLMGDYLVARPDAPSNLDAVAGDTRVTLTWDEPSNGGAEIAEYRIYRSENDTGTFVLVDSSSIRAWMDVNVTNGLTYAYRVSAVNSAGEGPNSSEVVAVPFRNTEADYLYSLSGDPIVATITGYIGTGGDIVIPSTLGGYQVVTIGDNAFNSNWDITSVVIPDSVTGINSGAFYGAKNLQSVDLGDGLMYIGFDAFRATALTSVFIPSTVEGFEVGAFAECNLLTAITVDVDNSYYQSIDGVVYDKPIWTLIQCPCGKPGVLNVADGVQWIPILSVTGASQLTSVVLPDTVTQIDTWGFGWCTSLTSFNIPSGVTMIGWGAFLGCSSLDEFTVDAANPEYATIDGVLYYNSLDSLVCCPGARSGSFVIPSGVIETESNAFAECAQLTGVTFPSGFTTVGDGTFADCENLVSIRFLGMTAPTTVEAEWLFGTPTELLGHAYEGSNFPAPGGIFHDLVMGDYIVDPPSVPLAFRATPGDRQVTLNWNAPSNGGSAITSYNVYRSDLQVGPYSLIATPIGTTYQDTGLTNGQTYWYKVSANNSAGEGPKTSSISSSPFTTADAPSLVSATPGDHQVALVWTAPPSNGGRPIDYYLISQDGVTLANHPTGLTFTRQGLTNGQEYDFKVAAHTSAGAGAWSDSILATPIGPPEPPGMVSAVGGHLNATVTWSAPSNTGGHPITGYRVYYGVSNPPSTYYVDCGASTFERTISPLNGGTTYYFSVTALNDLGESGKPPALSAIPRTVPSVPTMGILVPASSQISLTWSPGGNGGSPITSYNVYRSDASGGPYSLIASPTSPSHVDTGLTNGHAYWYEVSAVNIEGEGATSPPAVCTPCGVPGAPTNLGATPGNGQVSLSWTAPSSDGGVAVDYYVIYQDGAALAAHPTGLSTIVTGLTNGQEYVFAVAAHNPAGAGSQSSSIASTPRTVPGVPGQPTVIPGNAQVSLSWTAPTDNGGSTITGYQVYRSLSEAGTYGLIASPIVLSYLDTGVTNDTTYWYVVKAVNAAGEGAGTSPISTVPGTVPSAPLGLTATPGDLQISLTWSAPSHLGPGAITYHLFRNGSLIWSGSALAYLDSPLSKGVERSYMVAAENSLGWGPNCTAVTAIPVGVPDATWGLSATPGDRLVSLTWNVVNYSGPGTLAYHLFRDGAEVWSGMGTSCVDSPLTKGVTCSYSVSASNQVGWGANCSSTTATPFGAPDPPWSLGATPGDGNISLAWQAVNYSGPGTLLYHVYRDGVRISSGAATSLLDDGLTNGASYTYSVSASNSVGWSANCSSVSATPRGPPTTPIGPVAHSGERFVDLNWTAPTYAGPGTLRYHLYRNGTLIWSGSGLEHNDTNVLFFVEYSYFVNAENSIGTGPDSETVLATALPDQMTPSETRDLVATAGKDSASLSWDAPLYSNASAVRGYEVFYGTSPGAMTSHVSAGGLSAVVSGLSKNVTYYFVVRAMNDAGWGLNSSVASAVPFGVPSVPEIVDSSSGTHEAFLRWTAPSYPGPGTLTYHLFRDGALVFSGPSVSLTDTGLTSGQTYAYKVSASNSVGWGLNSTVVSVTTKVAPSAPVDLQLTSGNALVILTWSAPTDQGSAPVSAYKILRGTNSSALSLVTTITAQYYQDVNLTNGQTYYYRVCACSSVGDGAVTPLASATPSAPAPAGDYTLVVAVGVIVIGAGTAAFFVIRKRK